MFTLLTLACPHKGARWNPDPPAVQLAPVQEAGRRPARPLPYRPNVRGNAGVDGFTLGLGNSANQSTHFTVYGYAGEFTEPRHFDVVGKQEVQIPLPGGIFDLIVTGPNRFQHELKGTTAGAAAGVDVAVAGRRGKKDVELELSNDGPSTVTLVLKSLQYVDGTENLTLKSGHRKKLGWLAAEGWYDVEITSPDDASFRRRLTGREEDGKTGISGWKRCGAPLR
ncbi:UNVERIFIED_ORG: hypothetical protein ABIB13_002066 [Arthrobacter sp. UYEF2]